uniref:HicA toxin of toxin-antitoxin n=1 Tax=Candidatus Kentrum sp. DK TaxID=2126562 RepID=A0A450S5M5_9GAMM|nr:MAG: hypothetical protein BECKDK2373C_GA0170839_101731 [Candidatus Kentron sp. DK]
MKRWHEKTLAAIFGHPASANVRWHDIEALLKSLGGEIEEREVSRVAIILFGEVQVFHWSHPEPITDKGAVASVRRWLASHGVEP